MQTETQQRLPLSVEALALYNKLDDQSEFLSLALGASGFPIYEEMAPNPTHTGYVRATSLGVMPLTMHGFEFIRERTGTGELAQARKELEFLIRSNDIAVGLRYNQYAQFSEQSQIYLHDYPFGALCSHLPNEWDANGLIPSKAATILLQEDDTLVVMNSKKIYDVWNLANPQSEFPLNLRLKPTSSQERNDLWQVFQTVKSLGIMKAQGVLKEGPDYIKVPLNDLSADFSQSIKELWAALKVAREESCSVLEVASSWLRASDIAAQPGVVVAVEGSVIQLSLPTGNIIITQDTAQLLQITWSAGRVEVDTMEQLDIFLRAIIASGTVSYR